MPETILEIITEDGSKRHFNSQLKEIANVDTNGVKTLLNILGVGDVVLKVPDLEERVELPGAHQGFYVTRLPDISAEYNFGVVDPGGIRSNVKIKDIYTDRYEQDFSQHVKSIVYFGVGGLVFLTNEMEFHGLFGPKLEHQKVIYLGDNLWEISRGYASMDPLSNFKSFKFPLGKYIIVSDMTYDIYNVNSCPRVIANIKPSKESIRIPEMFHNLMPIQMADTFYILQVDKRQLNVYEIQQIGTQVEKLKKVKEIEMPNILTRINLIGIEK